VKDPAFLFYPNDYLGGTMGMTFEEKGAYMEILMMQFNRGHMTSHMIGQTVGQLWGRVKDKFTQDENGLWYNERLELEQSKRKAYTESRRNNKEGVNQYTKKKKSGHMDGHMENRNRNENKDVNEKKHKHGKYINVLLTNPEVEKLKKKFPNYDAVLQNFSEGIALKDYKYKSHYLAILKWNRNNQQENVKLTYEEVLKIHSGDFKTPGDKEIWDKLEKIKENDKTYWVYK